MWHRNTRYNGRALKEGWDNPNVFQICALREMATERERCQLIGRGLRLCVNQNGERLRGFKSIRSPLSPPPPRTTSSHQLKIVEYHDKNSVLATVGFIHWESFG